MLIERKKVIPLLRTAVSTLIGNKVVIFPFFIIAFVQLLLLELIYFSPRYPLNIFFGPLIRHFWSEKYLHFPYNFIILPRLYQNSFLQAFVYIFISSFFIASAIAIVSAINSDQHVKIRKIFREVMSHYFHIIVMAVISVVSIKLLFYITGELNQRALEIRSTAGIFFIIKRVVLIGAPYINLIFSVFVTTIFAYVLPIIVIEKKKIFSALWLNFKTLWGSFWFTFTITLIPVLFLIPIILLRSSFAVDVLFPEMTVFVLVLSAIIMVAIDAVIYTVVTVYYLFLKED